ncbi:putative membrane protein [Roseimicrobium gellanilyticum]|uniref:Putative membrane protein n=1 Tax=Roseimicrobium gellanilyticum TaxID=748857 RepID=A0A366HD32_9BACT|nr:DMT family transporter [Roseimicrobium gellanilyticum]RBP39749.1 putative membrane protein [Roseimicrobium gellanilyticum]
MPSPVLKKLQPYFPALFVLLWSSGFIGSKFGLGYAEPFTFLFIRMLVVAVLLTLVAWMTGAPWPKSRRAVWHLVVSGLLVHGIYLGGVLSAVAHGLGAGLVALIVGLQPLLTAVITTLWMRETLVARQWIGLVLGLAGVALVVSQKLTGHPDLPALALVTLALFGITLGTLYQKRFCGGMDLRTGTAVQAYTCAGLMLVLAVGFETMVVQWTPQLIFALLWLIFVLSIGAFFLLSILLRQGQSLQVTRLFYLTPPVTAVMAWLAFGEGLPPTVVAGFLVAALGVWMARQA